jgi:hypothetical protein
MFGYGPADNRLLKRTETANPPLLSTTTGVYQQLASTSVVGFGGQNEYDVSIKLKRIGSSLELTSHIYGSGYSSKFTHIDATPFTSFDTLAFYTVSNNVASMAVSNPIATYDGGSVALPSCPDATAKVLMTGANAIWPYGPRLLSPIGYAPYGLDTYQYGDEVVRYDGSAWIYENTQGIGEIVRVYDNQPRPWLVTWPNFTATKVCP